MITPTGAPPSELDQLVATEAELDAMLREARAGAQRLVDEERRLAEAGAAQRRGALAAAVEERRSALARERDSRIAVLRAEVAARAARYESVGEAEIGELADWAISELLGPAAA